MLSNVSIGHMCCTWFFFTHLHFSLSISFLFISLIFHFRKSVYCFCFIFTHLSHCLFLSINLLILFFFYQLILFMFFCVFFFCFFLFCRKKRALSDWLIAPNTKWCGRGQTADKYSQLGGASKADKCCRRHDHCKFNIYAMTTKWRLFNYRPFTISHCSCDMRLVKNFIWFSLNLKTERKKNSIRDLPIESDKAKIIFFQGFCGQYQAKVKGKLQLFDLDWNFWLIKCTLFISSDEIL